MISAKTDSLFESESSSLSSVTPVKDSKYEFENQLSCSIENIKSAILVAERFGSDFASVKQLTKLACLSYRDAMESAAAVKKSVAISSSRKKDLEKFFQLSDQVYQCLQQMLGTLGDKTVLPLPCSSVGNYTVTPVKAVTAEDVFSARRTFGSKSDAKPMAKSSCCSWCN